MKMGVFLRRGARREEGMALLFALGFLALMLILGLGFVTTSLLAQKLAANNGSRAQARMSHTSHISSAAPATACPMWMAMARQFWDRCLLSAARPGGGKR